MSPFASYLCRPSFPISSLGIPPSRFAGGGYAVAQTLENLTANLRSTAISLRSMFPGESSPKTHRGTAKGDLIALPEMPARAAAARGNAAAAAAASKNQGVRSTTK